MGRWGLGLLAAVAVLEAASAQEAPPSAERDKIAAAANAHCAALGPGFFAVAGSSACFRISGHISAGVGFAAAGHATAPPGGAFAEEGVSGDIRFDTPIGPGRIYVHVRDAEGPRWLAGPQ